MARRAHAAAPGRLNPLVAQIEGRLADEPIELSEVALAIGQIVAPRLDAEHARRELARLSADAGSALAALGLD